MGSSMYFTEDKLLFDILHGQNENYCTTKILLNLCLHNFKEKKFGVIIVS